MSSGTDSQRVRGFFSVSLDSGELCEPRDGLPTRAHMASLLASSIGVLMHHRTFTEHRAPVLP
jgi:hypothetical protein